MLGLWLLYHVRIVTPAVLRVQYLEVRLYLIAIILNATYSGKKGLNSMRYLKLAHILVPDIHGHTHFLGKMKFFFLQKLRNR